jgi:MerR family transcriptional regulator/heat shock protein HspR
VVAGRRHPSGKPLYMISVAAELTGLHPQTLRIYERKALVMPSRSAGNTRLYSEEDIERLKLVCELTSEGVNLAGVRCILELRDELERARKRAAELEKRAADADGRVERETERARRSYKAEIVHVRRGPIVRRQKGDS